MSLEELPAEITSHISSYLHDEGEREYADNGHPTLCSLALTCRRLLDVAINQLYCNIFFEVNSEEARDKMRMSSFNCACRANSSLVDRVHSARIRYSSYRGDGQAPLQAYDELLRHLSTSKSLTELHSQLGSVPSAPPLPALYDCPLGSFPALKQLRIELNDVKKEHFLPAEDLAKLCELPSLEQLTVTAPIGGIRDRERLRALGTGPFPHLKHLHFWAARPVSIAALETLLPRAPGLTCLQLGIPGDATEVNRKYSDSASSLGYDLDRPIHPRLYGQLLAPVAKSLKTLVIDADNVFYPGHDGSRIDVSHLESVDTLELSSALVLGPETVPKWNAELSRMFPPRLESFTVDFDGYQGLFWSLHDMRSYARRRNFGELWRHRFQESSVDWIVALLKRKGEQANVLKSIIIQEKEVVDRDANWKIVIWHGANRLNEMAAAVGIKLEIMLRVPRDFDSDEIEFVEDSWQYGAEGTVMYPDGLDPEGTNPENT